MDMPPITIQTILLEASGESEAGQTAVAEVIRNRARKRGLTPDQVVMQPKQFSAWNQENKAWAARRLAQATPEEWARATRAWEASEKSNLTFGADLYYNPALANPGWAKKTKRLAVLGNHVFHLDL